MRDLEHIRSLAWGLNLAEPDVTTQAEIDEFRRISSGQLGLQQDGLDFWLDMRPDVLKRYRKWADKLRFRKPGEPQTQWNANGPAILIFYAISGFEDGLRYSFHGMRRGLTKAQILEVLALAFRYVGPRGMVPLARAARAHEWGEPTQPVIWPEGWGPDPDAFRSGADFRTPGATAEDIRKIEAWYTKTMGVVPRHIRFLAKHRPDLLKVYRDRYENTLRVLPKQIEPYVLMQMSVQRGFKDGIRQGVLLGKSFGMAKTQVLEALSWGTFYGGTEALDLADEAAGDVLDAWT